MFAFDQVGDGDISTIEKTLVLRSIDDAIAGREIQPYEVWEDGGEDD